MVKRYVVFTVLALVSGLGVVYAQDPQAPVLVAEYRADRHLTDPGWVAHIQSREQLGVDANRAQDPWGIQANEVEGSMERILELGRYTISGAVDVRHRQSSWSDQPYSESHSITFGPKLFVNDNSVIHLYWGYQRDDLLDSNYRYGRHGDADTTRTGLAKTWHLANRKAQVQLGYEFEQGSDANLYDDMRGHSVSVVGKFPMFWGLRARIEADYSQVDYPYYDGRNDLESDRREFRAVISRAFTDRLYGGVHYSYYDEAFDQSEYSRRRQAWGLNFRYEY